MADDKMQLQRFELKYLISEEKALAIRDYLSSQIDHVEVDEFGAELPDSSYPVHSLYLDSPKMKLYHDTINGTKNRYKLRIRYYEDRPDAPVFFEIKRRMNNVILKQRGSVHRGAVPNLLAGHLPEPQHLVSKDPKYFLAVQRFCQLMSEIQAAPKVHILYLREAYLGRHDNSVRVTLDREVHSELEPTARLTTRPVCPAKIFQRVILELKFTNRFPNWFNELVSTFGVMQCGAAKYVDGVNALGGPEKVAGSLAVETDEDFNHRAKQLKMAATPLA
jgi:SPX domain protein involved in polyphosphate accumulation